MASSAFPHSATRALRNARDHERAGLIASAVEHYRLDPVAKTVSGLVRDFSSYALAY